MKCLRRNVLFLFSLPSSGWLLLLLWPVLVAGCSPAASSENSPSQAKGGEEEVELAPRMGELQRYSAKLGFAITGRNAPLAEFYSEELGEVLEELEGIEEHDGMPIAHPAGVILRPALAGMESALETADWAAIEDAYEVTIEACNRCHLATDHGFIKVLPAAGPSLFNQDFSAHDER